MEGERPTNQKRQLELDFTKLIDDNGDFEPPEVLRVKKTKPSEPSGERDEEMESMSDKELALQFHRQAENLKRFGSSLKDKGEKLRLRLKKLEAEQERRRLQPNRDTSRWEKQPNKPTSSGNTGGHICFREEATPSSAKPQSSFGKFLSEKLDGENQADCRTGGAFEKELSSLGRSRQNKNNSGKVLPDWVQKNRSSTRHFPVQTPSNFYRDRDKSSISNCDHRDRAASTNSGNHGGGNLTSCFAKKENRYQLRDRTKKSETILLVDEEEHEDMDTTEQTEEIPESMKESRIYYPSRDDPHSVEICYADTKCLDPQSYLTSAIMNFYIRYLHHQASSTDGKECRFHFFNTFFYNKLKDAVSEKAIKKDNLYVKLRRWWKGVDIFQKSYILIPINEDVHWSLVIICIPDKEEESGPIVLHLDSLGLHSSKFIFRTIKSFLKEEWGYLGQEDDGISDLTVSDCWKQLPDHIEEKKLVVPQQKNDYDCGLFVLFFMERFIEEAPERLKKKDYAMFGRQWFQPVEASRLRSKIWKLLKEEFQNAYESNRSKDPLSDADEE